MRLKKLEVFGFKSFADKTAVEFAPGITGVVGPNGCGKSNIADAFRWVLGEQSAKSMRGGKMQDVIFAGTSTRKPLNFAEVTITLTDVQGALPVEYEEVAVTRRLHRNGESEYLLNRHPVRLKDLQSMFMDSGMGKNAFAIFEQGKIDQIINLSPTERRYIFEDAAGILRFLQRKREALKKLEQTEQNMSRVRDIYREVDQHIKVLEEQAEKARLYKEHREELETLEKGVAVAKWDVLQERCKEGGDKEKEASKEVQDLMASLQVYKEELYTVKKSLLASEQTLRARSEAVYQVRNEQQLKNKEQLTHQERIEELQHRKVKLEKELQDLKGQRKQRASETENAQKKHDELEKIVKSTEGNLLTQREAVAVKDRDVAKLREQQRKTQQDRLQLVQEVSRIEGEIKQHTVRQETLQERMKALSERREALRASLESFQAKLAEKKARVQEALNTVERDTQKLAHLGLQIAEVSELLKKKEAEITALQREVAELAARQKVLTRMRDEMEGFSAGSKRLLQEAANAKSSLHKKLQGLYELMSAEKGMEAALALAMRPYAQTLVVKSKRDFEEVLAFARDKKLKDYSLLCLEGLDAPGKSQVVEGLVSLVDQAAHNPVMTHFLHRVYRAADAGQALEAFARGSEVCTDDGFFLDGRKVLFYVTPGENNAFVREAELASLDKSLQERMNQSATAEGQLSALEERRSALHNERLELDKKVRKEEMTHVEANFALQQASAEMKQAQDESKKIDEELAACSTFKETITTRIRDLEKEHAAALKKAKEIEGLSVRVDKDIEERVGELGEDHQQLQQAEEAFKKVFGEKQQLQHLLNVLEVQDQESHRQEEKCKQEIAASTELQETLREQKEQNVHALGDVEKALSGAMEACRTLEAEVAKKKDLSGQLETKITEENERLKKLEKEAYQIGAQLGQLQANCQAIAADLQERYQLSIEEARALNIVLKLPLEHAEKRLRSLRQQLQHAGDINMTSIEEYEKQKERHKFLDQQIGDMGGSKEELLAIIGELDGESRKIFKEVFEAVRANFLKNFQVLFRGGEADLQFTDDSDILEAGIDIVAKPPGKQMRSIQLLSGGEKCLTAVALLFAIFEVKPSPFCILDEIDAPLDESNVERFLNVVKQFIDRCQFIIITHNKRTMSIADTLYGVSMEERGVSRLLSMKFNKDKKTESQDVEVSVPAST